MPLRNLPVHTRNRDIRRLSLEPQVSLPAQAEPIQSHEYLRSAPKLEPKFRMSSPRSIAPNLAFPRRTELPHPHVLALENLIPWNGNPCDGRRPESSGPISLVVLHHGQIEASMVDLRRIRSNVPVSTHIDTVEAHEDHGRRSEALAEGDRTRCRRSPKVRPAP